MVPPGAALCVLLACGAPEMPVSAGDPADHGQGAAAAERVFDVVDPKLVRAVTVPVMDRDYGAEPVSARPLAAASALDATAASASSRPASTAVPRPGAALADGDVIGSRRRSDFACDLAHRRLVEEVTIELENRATAPRTAVVRERLYRGLNWTMAYFNGAGSIEKEAAQTVLFRVELPAGASRQLVYRVVYTW